MIPFRFVHTADLRLGSPLGGVDEASPRVAKQLKDATFQSFERLIDLCIESRADFLLVAGGVFDSRQGNLQAQLHFCDGLRRAAVAGIQAFVCHGDEDPIDSWSGKIVWPDRTHVFAGACAERVPALRDGQPVAQVYGISQPHSGFRENPVRAFPPRAVEDIFAIGMLHGVLETKSSLETCASFTFEDLASVGMDYWALGHLRTSKVVSGHGPAALYPGSPQGTGPAEAGRHGCYLVNVQPDGTVKPEFISIDVVRYFCESVSIEGLSEEGQLLQSLQRVCDKARQQVEGCDAVCRVVLEGQGPLHKSLRRPGFASSLVRRLRDEFSELEPFVWVGSLDNRTQPPLDMAERRMVQDFVGDLLRISESYRSDPARLASLRNELVALYSSQGRRLLAFPTDEEILGWLAAAEVECVDLLAGEENR